MGKYQIDDKTRKLNNTLLGKIQKHTTQLTKEEKIKELISKHKK